MREVVDEVRPERVFVLQVDAALRDAAEYTADDLPDESAPKGWGGTDFRPGFEWLDEQGIEPEVCLYFTDMECSSYPKAEPGPWNPFCDGSSWSLANQQLGSHLADAVPDYSIAGYLRPFEPHPRA